MSGPDDKFYERVDAHIRLSNQQLADGTPRLNVSGSTLFAAARFNAQVYLLNVKPIHAASERAHFLDYMTTMYRRMLNEHLDGMGQERGIDVGESELAAEYAAAGVQVGRAAQTPAGDYVASAGAVPPAASNE